MRLLARADARRIPLADESVHCVVCSPPYWQLRDYKVAGQIGLEETPTEFVEVLVEAFREVRRVLRDDGTLWLNIGDTYIARRNSGTGWDSSGLTKPNGRARKIQLAQEASTRRPRKPAGLKYKDLALIPFRLAIALQEDGWWQRQVNIWEKPACVPETTRDRPTTSHEYVLLLSKAERYFYDYMAVREPTTGNAHARGKGVNPKAVEKRTDDGTARVKQNTSFSAAVVGLMRTRNKRSVWRIPTTPYTDTHYAAFPEGLAEPCILAGTSPVGCCPTCGTPWRRIVWHQKSRDYADRSRRYEGGRTANADSGAEFYAKYRDPVSVGWEQICACEYARPVPCTVLDPFAGTGTTVRVANRLGRRGIGLDLSRAYLDQAARRTSNVQTEFAT